ncbi:TonB-dependent receptor [Acidicapsa ligni]|uniref:TonB-dependent receptor n=1 Tax=Acidicapsa ligni TaxID=542300 RepID=UPI0021E04832|nr:carboxypeptidase-like regulatory domain-containing protein [Acidicapsa ligni]
MFRLFPRLLFAVALIAVLGSLSLLGQSATGRFSGQVTDQGGNAISGATVQIVNQETLVKRSTKTNASGEYVVPSLPEGNYQIIVEADGFSRRASEVVRLSPGQVFVFNAQMSVGGMKTEVEVSAGAGATLVETNTASISTTMGQQEVAGYALNGRNFSQLITMAPGVSNQTGQDEAKVGVSGSAKFSVNGGRVEYNTFEVDGSDVLNTSINASRGQGEPLVVYPSIDAIQDMKVLTADYSALHGKSSSGSVLVTTKSGTEAFHGNGYGFLRNEIFNARNYFDQPDPVPVGFQGKRTYRTPLYRRLDFGATIGGPLFIPHFYNNNKNRTFFFFSEEVRREKTPVDYNQAVPSMAERGQGQTIPGIGDFSDVCPIPSPGKVLTSNPSAYPDCPQGPELPGSSALSVGNTVSVDYASAAILNSGIIPEPNSSSGCNSTNPSPLAHCYVGSVSPPTHWREELFRIDHNLTEKERLSFRYIHDAWDTVTLVPQWGVVQNSFPTVENQLDGPGLNMMLSLAQTLPHGFINLLSASYEVEHVSLAPLPGPGVTSLKRPAILDNPISAGAAPIPGTMACGQLMAPGGSYTPQSFTACPFGYIFSNGYGGNKLPGLDFQGNNGAYGGHGFAADTGYAPWNQANPTFNLRDDASKIIGKHTLQFGFEGTFVQQNELSGVTGANSGDLQGLLTFSNQQSIYTSGNAFADFLAGPGFSPSNPLIAPPLVGQGAIKSFTQDSGQVKYYNRYKIAELYLQDDWRVNSRLTINAGFRASLFGSWYNPKSTAYNWRPEAFNQSIGSSIYVDPTNSYLVKKSTGLPVPLNRNGPYSLASLDSSITNGLVQCGAGTVPNSCMTNKLFHPAPRVGFSWDPWGNGKTAIRAGYGLYWEHGTGYEANVGSLIGSAPLVLSETQSNVRNYNLIGLSCQGGTTQCGNTVSPTGGATFPLNVTSVPTKAVYSYTQQWSLSVQHEVRKEMVAQLAYVGTKGTHLTAVRDLNQLQPLSNALNPFQPGQPITAAVCGSGAGGGPFSVAGVNGASGGPITVPTSPGISAGTPGYTNMFVACTGNPGFGTGIPLQKLGISADVLRPYLGFSNIISVENIADSEYNAFQGTLRQTTGPLTVGVAYTWSHSVDDASDRSSANFANSLDIHSNHASSDFDQRHMLNVNYIYDLPLLRLLDGFVHLVGSGSDPSENESSAQADTKRNFAPLERELIGGWQLSGITTYQTGTPFSVINGGGSDGTGTADNAGVGDGLGVGSYADVIGNARAGKPFVGQTSSNVGPLLLNPRAFAAPRGLTFGDSGRNYLNNPSRINFNMSIFKHFKPFHDRFDIEFRAEAFNVFNHTQFRITDPANPGNTGNNVINCYGTQTELYSAGASGCLTGNSFLHPVDAHDPRILQFALKGNF